MSGARSAGFWAIAIGLLLLTRIPAAAQYFSVDNVNLALSLDDFNPRLHQPQPPGYPFFVGAARGVNHFFHSPEKTFLVISLLVSVLCLPVIGALGKRMFDQWVGQAAALLLLLNPAFWQASLDGPLRPHLALFSLLTAYCAWRAWNGDKGFVFWGALALGIGSGFRPDLLAFMTPLWLLSAWVGTRSIKTIVVGGVALGICVAVWVAILAYAVGGVGELMRMNTQYLVAQSQPGSVVLGASMSGWFRQVNRLVIWNGLAIIGWIWAVPLFLFSSRRLSMFGPQTAFMIAWLAPGLMAQALIHVAEPGHTLWSIPAFCLIGSYVLWAACERWQLSDVAMAAALIISVMLFLNYIPLPPAEAASSGSLWQSAKNAAIFGTFESSIGEVRFEDESVRVSLRELREFSEHAGRPIVVVCEDVVPKQDWFMVWPIARYYLPQDIWVLSSRTAAGTAKSIRRNRISSDHTGSLVTIPIPKGARIIWLMEHGGQLHQALGGTVKLSGGQKVFYTDLDPDAGSFRALNFEFTNAVQ